MEYAELFIAVGIFCLGLLVGIIKSYMMARSSETAKIDAVSEKIEQLISNQKLLTEATEHIKHQFEYDHWVKKEKLSLMKVKIEETYLMAQELSLVWPLYTSKNPTQESCEKYYNLITRIIMNINMYLYEHIESDDTVSNLHLETMKYVTKYSIKGIDIPKEVADELSSTMVLTITSLKRKLVESAKILGGNS
ncbi:hypothetical protein KW477_00280 [Vibrio fluvialis]|nr:hypothetical protein [Vibrio fluvialis]